MGDYALVTSSKNECTKNELIAPLETQTQTDCETRVNNLSSVDEFGQGGAENCLNKPADDVTGDGVSNEILVNSNCIDRMQVVRVADGEGTLIPKAETIGCVEDVSDKTSSSPTDVASEAVCTTPCNADASIAREVSSMKTVKIDAVASTDAAPVANSTPEAVAASESHMVPANEANASIILSTEILPNVFDHVLTEMATPSNVIPMQTPNASEFEYPAPTSVSEQLKTETTTASDSAIAQTGNGSVVHEHTTNMSEVCSAATRSATDDVNPTKITSPSKFIGAKATSAPKTIPIETADSSEFTPSVTNESEEKVPKVISAETTDSSQIFLGTTSKSEEVPVDTANAPKVILGAMASSSQVFAGNVSALEAVAAETGNVSEVVVPTVDAEACEVTSTIEMTSEVTSSAEIASAIGSVRASEIVLADCTNTSQDDPVETNGALEGVPTVVEKASEGLPTEVDNSSAVSTPILNASIVIPPEATTEEIVHLAGTNSPKVDLAKANASVQILAYAINESEVSSNEMANMCETLPQVNAAEDDELNKMEWSPIVGTENASLPVPAAIKENVPETVSCKMTTVSAVPTVSVTLPEEIDTKITIGSHDTAGDNTTVTEKNAEETVDMPNSDIPIDTVSALKLGAIVNTASAVDCEAESVPNVARIHADKSAVVSTEIANGHSNVENRSETVADVVTAEDCCAETTSEATNVANFVSVETSKSSDVIDTETSNSSDSSDVIGAGTSNSSEIVSAGTSNRSEVINAEITSNIDSNSLKVSSTEILNTGSVPLEGSNQRESTAEEGSGAQVGHVRKVVSVTSATAHEIPLVTVHVAKTCATGAEKINISKVVHHEETAKATSISKVAAEAVEDDVIITNEICADASHLCSKCGQIFATTYSLQAHLDTEECDTTSEIPDVNILDDSTEPPAKPNQKYRCDLCGRLFTFLWGFDQHISAHIRKLPSVMVAMEQMAEPTSFNGQQAVDSLITNELLQFSSLGEYMCRKCGRCFTSMDEMKQHAKRHLPLEMVKSMPGFVYVSAPIAVGSNENSTSGRRKKVLTWITRVPGQGVPSTLSASCSYCRQAIGSVQSLIKHVPNCPSLHQIKENFIRKSCLKPVAPRLSVQNGGFSTPSLPRSLKPFACECRQQFQNLWELQQHLQQHLDNGEMTSVHAAVVMRQNQPELTSNPFEEGHDVLTGKSMATCHTCRASFSSIGLLKAHKEKKHCITRLTWSECCSTMKTASGYYQCNECLLIVKGNEQFRLHMASHAEKKLNVFLRCKLQLAKALKSQSNSLPSSGSYGQPQVITPPVPDILSATNCPFCGASFGSRTLCLLHIKRFCRKNPNTSEPVTVATNSRQFNNLIEEDSLQGLAEEASGRSQSENETFPCKYCDIVCTSLLSYSRHFERHTQVSQVSIPQTTRAFVCLICSQRCKTQDEYNAHMKSHQQLLNNAVCTGCYRQFHPAYPLMFHQASGQNFCPKCAAAFKEGRVITTAPMRSTVGNVATATSVPHHVAPTTSYISAIPSHSLSQSRVPAKRVIAYNKNPNAVLYKNSDGTFCFNENDRFGYEKVLQSLGCDVATIAPASKTTEPNLHFSDDSNERMPSNEESADNVGSSNEEFMPTDFLSIEMPASDTNEQLIVEENTVDSEQVSQEHDYASRPPEQQALPFILYTESPPPMATIYDDSQPSVLSQLLNNWTPVRSVGSTPARVFNVQLNKQRQIQNLTAKGHQPSNIPSWLLAYKMDTSKAQLAFPRPAVSKPRPKPKPKRPNPCSLASNLSNKCAKLVCPTTQGPSNAASLYGLRRCSVVLKRLDLNNLPKVIPQSDKRLTPSKIVNVDNTLAKAKSSNTPRSSVSSTPASKTVCRKTVPQQGLVQHILDGSACRNASRSRANSFNSASGRESPECMVILEKVNGVIVPTSDTSGALLSKKRPAPTSRRDVPTDVLSSSKRLCQPSRVNFKRKLSNEKTFVIHNGAMIELKPCIVKLFRLDDKTISKYLCTGVKRRKLSVVRTSRVNTPHRTKCAPTVTVYPTIDIDDSSNDSISNVGLNSSNNSVVGCSSSIKNASVSRRSSLESHISDNSLQFPLHTCRVVVKKLDEQLIRAATLKTKTVVTPVLSRDEESVDLTAGPTNSIEAAGSIPRSADVEDVREVCEDSVLETGDNDSEPSAVIALSPASAPPSNTSDASCKSAPPSPPTPATIQDAEDELCSSVTEPEKLSLDDCIVILQKINDENLAPVIENDAVV